jgi:hypothetical protein
LREQFISRWLAQRGLESGLDSYLTIRQVLAVKHFVDVVLLVHEADSGGKKLTQPI